MQEQGAVATSPWGLPAAAVHVGFTQGQAACRYSETQEAARAAQPEVWEGETTAGRLGVFEKGQSKRIWGELYKVVDSSDVVIQVRAFRTQASG